MNSPYPPCCGRRQRGWLGHPEAPGDEVGPHVKVRFGVADDGRLSGGAAARVDPHDVLAGDREHPERVVVAQRVLVGERQPGDVVEGADILGAYPASSKALAVVGYGGIHPPRAVLQALQLPGPQLVERPVEGGVVGFGVHADHSCTTGSGSGAWSRGGVEEQLELDVVGVAEHQHGRARGRVRRGDRGVHHPAAPSRAAQASSSPRSAPRTPGGPGRPVSRRTGRSHRHDARRGSAGSTARRGAGTPCARRRWAGRTRRPDETEHIGIPGCAPSASRTVKPK